MGNTIALVAFFLPFARFTSGSLGDWLLILMRQSILQGQFDALAGMLWLSLALLLLLSFAVRAYWTVFFRLPSRNVMYPYLVFMALVLIIYFIIALAGFFFVLIYSESLTDLIGVLNLGGWLITVGLILALLGGLLLVRGDPRRVVEG